MKLAEQKIPSTKGDLAATIHYPDAETNKLAILCPGYLDTKDYQHLLKLAEALCEKNYVVVRFDPSGTWESGGDISDYTITQYLADIKSVTDFMFAQKHYEKVLLGGHSRGGQMSLLYAARDPHITLVLGIMPSHGPITGERREKWEQAGVSASSRDLPADRSQKREFRVPFTHVLDRDNYDAVSDVKKIHAPTVFVAGALDDLVPPEEVREIFDSANEPKKFLVLENIGHDYRLNDGEVALVNVKIMEQLAEYL